MATPKRFPTLVQLEQREGALFEVQGNLTKRPYWFHSEYLKSPKAVHLEAWLVEAIFGEWVFPPSSYPPGPPGWPRSRASLCSGPSPKPTLPPSTPAFFSQTGPAPHSLFASCTGPGGEHIPHVECVSQTLLHVNHWDPEGEAEILIFGRPYYQKDVSKMIMNLADHHRQLRSQSMKPGIVRGTLGRPWVSW